MFIVLEIYNFILMCNLHTRILWKEAKKRPWENLVTAMLLLMLHSETFFDKNVVSTAVWVVGSGEVYHILNKFYSLATDFSV